MDVLTKEQEYVKEAESIRKLFTDCTQFKESKGIIKDATRAVDFYEGRQWMDFQKKLNIEKPTLNFIQNVTDGKASSILQKTYKPVFVIDGSDADSKAVTKFSEWQMKEMDQENINKRLTYDGLLKGTFICYYYWDEDAVGTAGVTDGAIVAEVVDVTDFAVKNPRIKDVQKQEEIVIRSRESVDSIVKHCDTVSEQRIREIIDENPLNSNYTNDVEQTNVKYANVYTKFFRKNGEVYFEKSTDEILFQKPRCLNPLTNVTELKKREKENPEMEDTNTDGEYEQDTVNHQMMSVNGTEYTMEEQMENKFKARYYPITVDSFIERNNCIFGLSFAAQLIPMQKAVNQLATTQIISAAKQTMPTIVAKKGALGTSQIDMTKAGGIITDNSPVGTQGLYLLNPGSMPTAHYELAQSLISTTKDVWRASDVLDDGRNIPSGMSGYAINQLLQVQDKPVAQWQQVLARMISKEGRILEMFYKLFYRNKVFSSYISDAEMLTRNNMAKQNGEQPITSHYETQMFNGSDYLNTPFNVTIEVCESARYSEVMLTTMLETIFLNGTIEKLSPEYLMMWTELVPDYVFPKKEELRLLLNQKMNSQITQLQQQNQQLQQMIEQLSASSAAMQKEFTNKIDLANAKVNEAQRYADMVGGMYERSKKGATTSQE